MKRRGLILGIDPPAPLCGWALAQLGIDAQRLIVIHGRDGAHGTGRGVLEEAATRSGLLGLLGHE